MTASTPSRNRTAEHARLAQATGRLEDGLLKRTSGTSGDRTSPSVPGAPCGRTTATAVMPGVSFLMIMRDPGRTDGMKTVWPV
jgi:hypothetical protein